MTNDVYSSKHREEVKGTIAVQMGFFLLLSVRGHISVFFFLNFLN